MSTSNMPGSSYLQSAETQHLLYLYCIVERGTAAHQMLEQNDVPGLEPNEPLFPVDAGRLVAAVSRVPSAVFSEESLSQLLKDVDQLAPLAFRHDRAIRTLMSAAPAVIPISLGAVYLEDKRIVALLRDRADALGNILERLRNKQEWGLKVFSDRVWLTEATKTISPELNRLAEEAAHSNPGRSYLIRKQQERVLAREAGRLERESLDAILKALTSASSSVQTDDLPNERPGPVPLLLKASFLVESESVETFHSVAEDLEQRHASLGLQIEVDGPWAPYSFVSEQIESV